jgi:hypothetical protein
MDDTEQEEKKPTAKVLRAEPALGESPIVMSIVQRVFVFSGSLAA